VSPSTETAIELKAVPTRADEADRADRPVPIIELVDVGKVYKTGELEVEALRSVSLRIDENDLVAITGPSGSGKSTLMHIIGCLDVPTSGVYRLAGHDVQSFDEMVLADVRNLALGFVFQQFNLLPYLPAWRNVELPLVYSGVATDERRDRALAALGKVGLAERADHRPGELSGGQQQRVAIARAVVTEPTLILADEPTGNLDSTSSADVLSLLRALHGEGRTIAIITHERDIAALAERVVEMRDGQLREPDGQEAPALRDITMTESAP
jgi:putative ABC transport system ATP-binding protein